jgi:hypothetical protein
MQELFEIVPAPVVIAVFVFGVAVTVLACLPTEWVGRVVELARKRLGHR